MILCTVMPIVHVQIVCGDRFIRAFAIWRFYNFILSVLYCHVGYSGDSVTVHLIVSRCYHDYTRCLSRMPGDGQEAYDATT